MAEQTNAVTPPNITGVIDQQFFIEPQGGPQHPISYLDDFPETLYTKSLNSNLVALMYALLGPAGMGALRQNYLRARLAVEDNGIRTTDLDKLYADPFSFARLATEEYQDNTTGLLNNTRWTAIQIADAEYKNRAVNYLKALRAGGTLLGVTLAAKSGLARAVTVIENYRALYDKFSDNPLGLEKLGVTNSTEEIVLLPRQELPRSALQTLTCEGNPISGSFSLVIPMGPGRAANEPNRTRTRLLPYNITFNELRSALEEVPAIGAGNVLVKGGPFPGNKLEVSFTGGLSDRPIPILLVPSAENSMTNGEGQQCAIKIENAIVGVTADGETGTIPPENLYYAQVAIGNLKPVTTIISAGKSPGTTKRQLASTAASDSEFVEVIRYVTGNRQIPWPALDSTHWIQSGIEHEAPVTKEGQKVHYANWHNISLANAYTETALNAPNYEKEPSSGNEHVGGYSGVQAVLFPFLAVFTDPLKQFEANSAFANPPAVPTLQEEGLIEGVYPTDYAELKKSAENAKGGIIGNFGISRAVFAPSETTPFWSSTERATGSDYLEIDLGRAQATNCILFDVSNKPYDITVSYDVLDQAPERRFVPVTFVDPRSAESTLSIGHNIEAPNPWRTIELNFYNALGGMIFTRFIRIAFQKRTGESSPFTTEAGELIPFSVEVKNLRLGRNLP